MRHIQTLLKDWLPPIAMRTLMHIKKERIWFQGSYASWDEAAARCTGYSAEHILAKVQEATLKVKRGEAAFERDSVLFDEIEYVWPVLAGLLSAAAQNNGALNVLDFGGALGSSYFQNRRFLDTLAEVRWNIVEQPNYVRAGQNNIQDDRLRFYPSIGSSMAENQPNAILLSSVLQYLQSPFDVLQQLSDCGASCMIIDRTIVNYSNYDSIYIQHVPSTIYQASYPCRSLSEEKLISALSSGYVLEAAFKSLEFPALEPIHSEFKGFIFRKQ